ncbi:hypothetical protein GR232_36110 [Rhizobium leguminosarum]|uniref:hypothetical protein n=1 Tax=Rhizobium ruizarguesonis TaxID=2081791 RepID=UPI0013B6FADF|nr:hypothetical protein [Rhizobium ruizarguesonis]NEI32215.1 hypothetical protein [Rhizobium ruizarguesonis]
MLIERRVPEEALPWLRQVIVDQDWQTLRGLGRDADAATIRARVLAAANAAYVPEPERDADISDDAAPVLGRK